ncbi:hypothetical protein DEI99_012805 [Curtobacterium sp. MCLR17_036]|uniref:hypothetical protein n=1 Tax=Curtobacterium sp. MCLR17_036 TaxID=2175620 RepID=UPI000DAAA912|nr:hypothetical protein [Curtobacterium sp. MCLR17_036]WIE64110.1 hypothetical protein DEI99_012805 [Curtobacterium sp. MCLR17_036]
MSGRLRLLLAVLVCSVLVASGSGTAWALWSTSRETGSSTTMGTPATSLALGGATSSTFSSLAPSVTKAVTLRNPGNIAGTTTTTVSSPSGTPEPLASWIDVVAWRVPSVGACTDDAPVGSGSVSGTWAALPSLTTPLAVGASAVWCTRSTPKPGTPAEASANIVLSAVSTTGTWRSDASRSGFYLNTAPAITCTERDGTAVDITWPTSTRPATTPYGAFVRGTPVGTPSRTTPGQLTVRADELPADGTQTVVVQVLDDAGRPTTTVAGEGPVTRSTDAAGQTIRCGA